MSDSIEQRVHVNDATVRFGPKTVLDKISLEIQKKEFISVVGKSGSGKSTFLHLLAGFVKPVLGTVVTPDRIGLVLQKHPVFPWLSAGENIAFGLRHLPKLDQEVRVKHYLSMIGLESRDRSYPAELSGGEVQRVALARALAPNPDLILMDEPLGALDAYTRERMQEWLLNFIAAREATIVLVTHSVDEAIFLSDRVLLLRDHKFVREWPIPFNRPRELGLRFTSEFADLRRVITEHIQKS